jgi:redox-sensing transcriptional repressor
MGCALLQATAQETEVATTSPSPDRLTVGVAARLSRYLQVLTQAKKMGKDRISSQEISDYTNINATQIRRDLSTFGKFGKRGVGYNIDSLLGEIRKILRTQGQHNIALVGAGRLGQAIASSPIFAEHGINIAAVFDSDPEKVGRRIGSMEIGDSGLLAETVREKNIIVGVLAVPAESAQQVADNLVGSGVKIIFNYSEALLDVPGDVTVHTSNPAVDLLHALYFHLT